MMVNIKIALITLFSGFVAQAIKIVSYYIEHKRINFKRFYETGGMPSSHASTAMTLTLSVGLTEGFSSIAFIIALYFSVIIMYDAAGIRRAAGKQAAILNKIVSEIKAGKHITEERLVEFLGHTPMEVIMGAILGILIAIIFS